MYNQSKVKNGKLIFRCGCSFDIIEERPNHIPLINHGDPYSDWNYNCEATKMLLADGNTLGVFQLESNLGQHWCKELKPESEEHMSALTAIIRPGVLEVKDENGVNATQKYCMYKNGQDRPMADVPILNEILDDTYCQMIYQEDIMRIAVEIAGFTGAEANALMKGVGKKLQDVIAGLKQRFIEGCKKVGKVTEEEATKIFENIEKSGRYLFNHSHGVGYGKLSLVTAFAKAHFPEYFYAAYLEGADNKQDPLEERYELIRDAKNFDIEISKPSLSKSDIVFYSPENKSVLFGLSSIKSVGKKSIDKIRLSYSRNTDWLNLLVNCLYKINIKAAQNIIKAGIIENGMSRKRQLHELNILCELTVGQYNYIASNLAEFRDLKEALISMNRLKKEGGGLHSINDKAKVDSLIFTLDNPGFSLEDTPEWISSSEEEILGIGLSASVLDGVSVAVANTSCRELKYGKNSNNMIIACQIDKVEEKVIKSGSNKGKKYAKMDISDSSGNLKGINIWPELYEKYNTLIKERNTISMKVYINKREEVSVNNVYQI